MATTVIKRDGSRQPFDEAKLRRSLEAAADDAGMAPEKKTQVVEQVFASLMDFAQGVEEISTRELRERALQELDLAAPEAAEAWRRYDQSQGKS